MTDRKSLDKSKELSVLDPVFGLFFWVITSVPASARDNVFVPFFSPEKL